MEYKILTEVGVDIKFILFRFVLSYVAYTLVFNNCHSFFADGNTI